MGSPRMARSTNLSASRLDGRPRVHRRRLSEF
jgi:hypothetical protein